uniref:Anaphase-promoting complex subunit 4-like WD40 domain-containing protein n=1 Tax=Cucumis melo TaxID=3656 RepID=A0A9I9EF55_CUCME
MSTGYRVISVDVPRGVLPFQLQFDKRIAFQVKIVKWNPENDLLAMVIENSKILFHRFNWQRLWTISLGEFHDLIQSTRELDEVRMELADFLGGHMLDRQALLILDIDELVLLILNIDSDSSDSENNVVLSTLFHRKVGSCSGKFPPQDASPPKEDLTRPTDHSLPSVASSSPHASPQSLFPMMKMMQVTKLTNIMCLELKTQPFLRTLWPLLRTLVRLIILEHRTLGQLKVRVNSPLQCHCLGMLVPLLVRVVPLSEDNMSSLKDKLLTTCSNGNKGSCFTLYASKQFRS